MMKEGRKRERKSWKLGGEGLNSFWSLGAEGQIPLMTPVHMVSRVLDQSFHDIYSLQRAHNGMLRPADSIGRNLYIAVPS